MRYNLKNKKLIEYSEKREKLVFKLAGLEKLIKMDPEDEDLIRARERVTRDIKNLDNEINNLKTKENEKG